MKNQRMSIGKYWISMGCVIGSFFIVIGYLNISGWTNFGGEVLLSWWLATRPVIIICGIKRLHDFNATGWWLLVSEFVLPPIGAIIIGTIPGTEGDNKYGPEPQKILGHRKIVAERRKAAEEGYATAQYNLGWMYYRGAGVKIDYVKAHLWFHLAAAQGYKNAHQLRDELAQQMTPDQIAKNQRLAREMEPTRTGEPR